MCLLHRDAGANICRVCVRKRQTGARITVARLFLGASGRPFTVLNLNGPSIRSAGDAAAREIRVAGQREFLLHSASARITERNADDRQITVKA